MIDDVSQDALFRVLRQRLGYINVLPYIVAFNQRTADEQLNFMLADDDRKQWQVGDSQLFFGNRVILKMKQACRFHCCQLGVILC